MVALALCLASINLSPMRLKSCENHFLPFLPMITKLVWVYCRIVQVLGLKTLISTWPSQSKWQEYENVMSVRTLLNSQWNLLIFGHSKLEVPFQTTRTDCHWQNLTSQYSLPVCCLQQGTRSDAIPKANHQANTVTWHWPRRQQRSILLALK